MNTDTVGSMPSPRRPLRVLFVNRMAGMVRGGGETFDLEISRHLAELGCEVTVLTGRPVVKRAVLGPREWWGRAEGAKDDGRWAMGNSQSAKGPSETEPPLVVKLQSPIDDERRAMSKASAKDKCSINPQSEPQSPIAHRTSPIVHHFLRSPWLGWFPWDKVRGGWRIRLVDLWLFEWRAARWVMRHQDEFDVIQICELPELVKMLKRWGCRAKVSMRLPGPQLYPGYGKGAVELADLLIASGTSINFYRAKLNRELIDIPNGVDTKMFRPKGTTDEHRWTPIGRDSEDSHISNPEFRALRVIYVARLTKIKNHGLLLRAVAGVKAKRVEVKVTLVGSGPLRGDIEGMVKQLGLEDQVELLGEVPYEQLPELYQAADVAVVASDYESFGFVVLEAMACGLPVLSTRVGIIPELLGAGEELQVAGCKLQVGDRNHGWTRMNTDGEETDDSGLKTVDSKRGLPVAKMPVSNIQYSTLNIQYSGKRDSDVNDDDNRVYLATCNVQRATSFFLLPGGLVVPAGDEDAMMEGLGWMMKNRASWGRMGAFNRKMVTQCYSWDASAEKLLSEYRRAEKRG